MRRIINLFLTIICLFSLTNLSAAKPKTTKEGYVVVTVKADGKRDVSDAIQKIIDEKISKLFVFI